MKKILLALTLLLFAHPAHALTGKVLAIVCDKLGAAENIQAHLANEIAARCKEVQGWKQDVCTSSDTTFLRGLFPRGYAFSTTAGDTSTGANYGKYDMAVMLNMPLLIYVDTDAECVTYGMPHFAQMIDRNSVWASPIPLLVPIGGAGMVATNGCALAYTGTIAIATLTSGKGEPYTDAQGDSLYIYTPTQIEARVSDSLSWVKPLVWRDIVIMGATTTTQVDAFESGTSTVIITYPRTISSAVVAPTSQNVVVTSYLAGVFVATDNVNTPAGVVTRTCDELRIARAVATAGGVSATYTVPIPASEAHQRKASMWMTVGSGNHRIVWLPNASADMNSANWITAFAMFTKVRPVELPVIAYIFGRGDLNALEVGKDTVRFGAGFKRNVDYAVANGIKLELLCYPYYMKTQNITANKTQAVAYQTAHPDNIRLTMSSGSSWCPTGSYPAMLTPTGTYATKVSRIKYTQDSLAAFFPTISATRLEGYGGYFCDFGAYDQADVILKAIGNRNISDVYNWGPMTAGASGAQYPADQTHIVVGPQRTWVNDGTTLHEMRLHTIGFIARYTLQEWNTPEMLKGTYVDTATCNLNRSYATATSLFNLQYGNQQAGIYLPALTFCGGSKLSWSGSTKATRRASVDSTRSIFLDTMKQLNAMKKMGDYIVSTYGINGTSPMIWSWLSDVKWDRKNGRAFSNSHVRQE